MKIALGYAAGVVLMVVAALGFCILVGILGAFVVRGFQFGMGM